jgi:nucleotidyltransferase substrate binding protein (TIGR01987 family)
MSPKEKTKLADSLENLTRAVKSLDEAVALPVTEQRDLAGIIKNFEFVYELTWLSLKRALAFEGKATTTPRSVFSVAFQEGFIEDEKTWLKILDDRNDTVHTYDAKLAEAMADRIIRMYAPLFRKTLNQLKSKYAGAGQ